MGQLTSESMVLKAVMGFGESWEHCSITSHRTTEFGDHHASRRFIRARPATSHGTEAFMTFSELVRLLEANGFRLLKEKGSIRYYSKQRWPNLVRVDYH